METKKLYRLGLRVTPRERLLLVGLSTMTGRSLSDLLRTALDAGITGMVADAQAQRQAAKADAAQMQHA
jgi:hypothetical protein